MNEEENLTPNKGTIKKESLEGKIEFRNVKFAYDEKQQVLKGINFTVNPSETVAIVGATGAGKSTIISLITRLYDITDGQILVDDTDIYDYELYHYRSQNRCGSTRCFPIPRKHCRKPYTAKIGRASCRERV